MTDAEYDIEAAAVTDRIMSMPANSRVAAACRGSANPAALAWLSEALDIGPDVRVGDFGAGIGGPAAWLARHWRCDVVAVDPAPGSVRGARALFEVPVVQAAAQHLPFRLDAFDVGLLLGVISVVEEPGAVLREVGRVASRLGVLDYCSSRSVAVHAGGSTFPTPDALIGMCQAHGWSVSDGLTIDVLAPPLWTAAAETAQRGVVVPEAEREVIAAIESGALTPFMLTAFRRTSMDATA